MRDEEPRIEDDVFRDTTNLKNVHTYMYIIMWVGLNNHMYVKRVSFFGVYVCKFLRICVLVVSLWLYIYVCIMFKEILLCVPYKQSSPDAKTLFI